MNPVYHCLLCSLSFKKKKQLQKHVKSLHRSKEKFRCLYCSRTFRRHAQLEKHSVLHRCSFCEYVNKNPEEIKTHEQHHMTIDLSKGGAKKTRFDPYPFIEVTAFKGYVKTFRHRLIETGGFAASVGDYFIQLRDKIFDILTFALDDYKSIKLQTSVLVRFKREKMNENSEEICEHYINGRLKILLNKIYITEAYSDTQEFINNSVNVFEKNGSGWILDTVLGSDIRIAEFEILRGGCVVPLPSFIKDKRAVISPQNAGNRCFIHAFLIASHHTDLPKGCHKERLNQYNKFQPLYDFSCLDFPTGYDKLEKFEVLNEAHKFSLTAFGVDNRNIINVKYLSKYANDPTRKHIDLLYVQDSANGPGHWMAITNTFALLGKTNCHRRFLCYNCLKTFSSEEALAEHQITCFEFPTQKVFVPKVNVNPDTGEETLPYCKFENFERQLKFNYCIYADFEALNVRNRKKISEKSTKFLDQVPCGFAFVVVGPSGKLEHQSLYRGEDCMDRFIQEIDEVSTRIKELNMQSVPMLPLSRREKKKFARAKECHICRQPFKTDDKVGDHNNLNGKFRGVAHRQCNAEFTQSKKTPVVMHNFKSFDSQLLISSITKLTKQDATVIAQSGEKFLSIITPNFLFVDSLMHLSSSLDSLCSTLIDEDNAVTEANFSILEQFFGKDDSVDFRQKGLYPYEHMDSWERFHEAKFPKRQRFRSLLKSELISRQEHKRGKEIFNKHCKNLGEYHDLYLMCDTLQLACIFEKYRTLALCNYKLDPLYYFSLAGFVWDAALLYTGQELELLRDIDMYLMLESGLRGGISMISHRHAEANNKYMKSFDNTKPENFIFFIDKVQLYAEALMQPLPVADFSWEDPFLFKPDVIKNLDFDGEKGYIFMVDLEYPEELHTGHSEYPLAPEKICIQKENLSPYQTDLLEHYQIPYSQNQKKLIPHLGPRERYVVHYRSLIYYLKKGMILKRVHKVISFTQKRWLYDYILKNSELRKHAKTKFEKDFFKFIINAVFGKSMEQVRNRQEVRIISDKARLGKWTRHSNYKDHQILSENVVLVFMTKPVAILNKPLYTASAVLDDSKRFMYQWFYDNIKHWYGGKAKFLATDTDSMILQIFTEDLYKDLIPYRHLFDFSEYDPTHFLHSEENRKRIGCMADEAHGKIITSFVGLAPKMYCVNGEGFEKIAAKGVKKSLVKQAFTHSRFKRVLFNQKLLVARMNLIRSKNHKLTVASYTKRALHCFESKRFILPDGITTLAHNHFLIKPLKRLMNRRQ